MAKVIRIRGKMAGDLGEAGGIFWGEMATPDDGTKAPKVAELSVVDHATWPEKVGRVYSLRLGPRGGLRLVEIK